MVYPGIVSVVGVLPVAALGPLAFDVRHAFELSTVDIGFASAGFFVGSALGASLGGLATSRFSGTAVIRVGLLVSAVISVAMGLSQTREELVAGCLLAGVMNGVIAPAINVLIMESTPSRRRGLAFGIKTAAVPTAATLAAFGVYLVASFDVTWRMLYMATGLVGAVAVVLARGGTRPRRAEGRTRHKRSKAPWSLRLLGIGGLLGSSGGAVMTPFLVDGLVAHGQSPADAAKVLAISGWLGIVMRIVVGVLSDRRPQPLTHLRILAGMLAVGGIGLAGIGLADDGRLLVASSLLSFGIGWSWPGLFHYATMSTHSENQAAATSFAQTGTFAGAVIGPLGFGYIAESRGFAWAWSASACVLAAAACTVLVGVFVLRRAQQAARRAAEGEARA